MHYGFGCSFFASLSSFQGTIERFFRNALRKHNLVSLETHFLAFYFMPLTAAKSILPHSQARLQPQFLVNRCAFFPVSVSFTASLRRR
jgi:hypothetical protein